MKTVELHSNKLNVLLLFQTAPLRVDGQRRPVSATILQRRQFNITSKAGLGKCWPVKSYHGQLSISNKLPGKQRREKGGRNMEVTKKGRREREEEEKETEAKTCSSYRSEIDSHCVCTRINHFQEFHTPSFFHWQCAGTIPEYPYGKPLLCPRALTQLYNGKLSWRVTSSPSKANLNSTLGAVFPFCPWDWQGSWWGLWFRVIFSRRFRIFCFGPRLRSGYVQGLLRETTTTKKKHIFLLKHGLGPVKFISQKTLHGTPVSS